MLDTVKRLSRKRQRWDTDSQNASSSICCLYTFLGLLLVVALTTLFVVSGVEADFDSLISSNNFCSKRLLASVVLLPMMITANLYLAAVLPYAIESRSGIITYLQTLGVFIALLAIAMFGIAVPTQVVVLLQACVVAVFSVYTLFTNLNRWSILANVDLIALIYILFLIYPIWM